MLAYPTDRAAYARLCRLLTLGKGRSGKGGCDLAWKDLVGAGRGPAADPAAGCADERLADELRRLRAGFPGRCYLSLSLRRRPGDPVRLRQLHDLAQAARVPTVVTGDVLYHEPGRRILQDVVTCIREGCTIDEAGFRRERFADRHLKAPDEMWRLFRAYPEALARTVEIADRCRFSLSELRYQYPDEADVPGETPQQALVRAVRDSIPLRYPDGLPPDVARQLRHELTLIEGLEYAPYFLTVNTIVRYARSKDILCQGRGSAANSAVCYVLGVTSIDPVRSGLLFERFISAERREPPDIDVDFESERREEVIQWVYERYGRDRAALCCTVMRFRARGAIRDVGKVMGLTEDVTGDAGRPGLGLVDEGVHEEHAEELNLNLADRRLRLTLQLARELIGFPRQLGTHPGGFVLTQDRLDDLVPIEPAAMADRQVIEWDKDDIDALKFMKVDVLGLGMLGCMRRSFELLEQHHGIAMDIATIPAEDPATYAMIRKADTLGTFQIESRAQMSMLPRLKPTTFYDLVVQVAIVRPGPIQGDMVHPYLRRREGMEPVHYPKPELRARAGQDAGRAAVPGAGDAGRHPVRRLHAGRGGPAAAVDGDLQVHRRRVALQGQADRRDGRQGLRAGLRRADLQPAGGVRLLRLPGKPCRQLRAGRLRQQLDEVPPPGRVLRRAAEQPADGLLRPGAGRAGRARARRRDPAGLRQRQPLGLHAGAAGRSAAGPCGAAGPAHGEGPGERARGAAGRAPGGTRPTQRRGGLAAGRHPGAPLERLAEADAFQGIGLDRRQALWAVKGLADSVLPLFAAADAAGGRGRSWSSRRCR